MGGAGTADMSDLPFNVVDAVVVVLVVLSAIFAFFRGFTREVLAIAAWVGAALAAAGLYKYVVPYASGFIGSETLATAVAVGSIFLVALILFSIATHAVAVRVQRSAIGPLDRTLGFVFGVIRGIVVAAIGYLVVANIDKSPEDPAWMRGAKTLPIVRASADMVWKLIPEAFRVRGTETIQQLESQGNKALDGAKALDKLSPGSGSPTPAPVPPPAGTPPVAPPTTAAPAPPAEPGYSDSQRKELEQRMHNAN